MESAHVSGTESGESTSEASPSQETAEYWLVAERLTGSYPEATENCGKWLIFVPSSHIDAVWKRVKEATEMGRFGGSAKVSTARPNPNATDPDTKVICVYTYDWTDQQDVRRVRQELRESGVVTKIPYKADADTHAKRYAVQGDRRISKYFE